MKSLKKNDNNDMNDNYSNLINNLTPQLIKDIMMNIDDNTKLPTKELIMIGATTSIAFAILDMVSPTLRYKKT
jgi:hypothetical protein